MAKQGPNSQFLERYCHFMQNKYWQALVQHQKNFTSTLPELFEQDEHRFRRFSLQACDLLFDYSKQYLKENTLSMLFSLVEEAEFDIKRQALFSGEKINLSEGQPALHSALRDFSLEPVSGLGNDIKQNVQTVLLRLEKFLDEITAVEKRGVFAEPIKDVICLGIGGSELGPVLLCEALQEFKVTKLNMHFVSNLDAKTITRVLNQLDPKSSICIISSKSFSTIETLHNANVVKAWFENCFTSKADALRHLFAVTANKALAVAFGILSQNIFEFWPWVGGRYSIWSAVGLPAILSMGIANFKEFLRGAYEMDQHFQTAPLQENMPVLMALISIWNRNFWHCQSQAIIPYDDGLAKLSTYIQQLEMESNGKSVDSQGEPLLYSTAPVIWGGVGCNSQHAFMQLLHQGSDIIPVDFLIGVSGQKNYSLHQQLLLANCFAQSKALMEGYSNSNSNSKFNKTKDCPGNRPSSTIIYPKLTPKILGSLLALFEHKVFVQGVIWRINSFDQWGVELGKTLAKNITESLANNLKGDIEMDSSTQGLMQFAKDHAVQS